MNAENLSKVGSRLVKRCGTRDPFSIARQLGIEVLFCENFGPLKGMYRVIKRSRFIFVNENLSGRMQRIVCAHELGHDQLHRNLAKGSAIQEFMLYDMTTKPEYEANIVAAEILLDTDEILEYIYDYGYTSEQIARAMGTDINLVALKIAHLAESGYDLRRIEHMSFVKDIGEKAHYLCITPEKGGGYRVHIMINYFEELMSEEYRSYLKYETLMEDEELASMFDIPELSPEEEAVVQLINEILDRFDSETQVDRTTAFKAAIRYLMQQDEEEAMKLEKIAATLTVLLENVLEEEKNVEEQES